MSDVFEGLLKQFGVFALLAGALWAVLRPLLQAWLQQRVEAGIEEGLKKRLAAFQLDLDKDLARYRLVLSSEADRLRSSLERDTLDYGIYANRRHSALAGLFEDFLRAELLVVDMSDLNALSSARLSTSELSEALERLGAPHEARVQALGLRAVQNWGELDALLASLVPSAERTRALTARNGAYEAYFRHALYLPEQVDRAAVAVRDFYHIVAMPYVIGTDRRGVEAAANKVRLRALMLDYQNVARADLSRSTVAQRHADDLALAPPGGAALQLGGGA